MRSDLAKKSFIILVLFLLATCGIDIAGQTIDSSGRKIDGRENIKADKNAKKAVPVAEPDTNFTFEKYGKFLKKISDTAKFVVLPLNEFRTTFDSTKIVIGLRHDVDVNLSHAFNFSDIEYGLGFRSTYFILHTAPYYIQTPGDMSVHNENIIATLKNMQDERHFEIGWHNDLVTLQIVYKINPVDFLKKELDWLRSNGIRVTGTASHGSPYSHTYGYLNYYFFKECSLTQVMPYINTDSIPVEGKFIRIIKGKLGDFDLNYEAYFLNYNKAFSDATIKDGIRWNISMLDPDKLKPGDRAVILLHPIHWHKASVKASIKQFNIDGQKASYIDTLNSTVTIVMPYNAGRENLRPSFTLSPGAYSKVAGSLQRSGVSFQDFSNPVTYTVFAENRDITKKWTVMVRNDLVLDVPGEEKTEGTMEIYPNPSDALINIRIEGAATTQKIEIYSFNGRKVYQVKYTQTGDFTKQVDLSFLKSGVYVVRNVTTGKKVLLIIR